MCWSTSYGKTSENFKKNNPKKIFIGLDINQKNLNNNRLFFDYTYLIPSHNKDNFLDFILKKLRVFSPCILIPGADEEAVKISENIKIFNKENIICNVMHESVIKSITDKFELGLKIKKISKENSIKSLLVERSSDLVDYALKLGYPKKNLIIKPKVGRGRKNTFILTESKKIEQNKDIPKAITLNNFVKDFRINSNYLLMQYIKGNSITVDVLANEGKLVFLLARKWSKAWRFPFPGQRVINNIKIKNLIKKLFKVYHFHGLFDIDIIIDENEKVFILEINPRPSGSILVSEIIE